MNKLFRRLFGAALTVLVLSPVYAGAAEAASLTVAVQQVNSNSAAQTVTCTLLQQGCVLPFVINAGQPTQQAVNVHVVYFQSGLTLNFHTPNGYFATQDTAGNMVVYNTMWHRLLQGSTPATYTVTLFQPLTPFMSPQPLAKPGTTYTPVTSLKVTATLVP